MKKSWKNLLIKLYSFFIAGLSPFEILAEKNYRADEVPHPLTGVTIQEHLGASIDLSLVFTNENNQNFPLKEYFKSEPVLMTVIYYNCPSLCNFHLNGLFEGLEKLSTDWTAPYQFVVVSMDSTEKASLAREKKTNYFKKFKSLKGENVHFLTGSENSIEKLTGSLGFSFRWDEETQQFAHSPVAYTLSPKGIISRYIYGIEFKPKTLKLSLLEAGEGKIGNVIDRILLFCYRFNPKENKYTLYAVNIMKAGGILMILALLFLLVPVWIKERNQNT